MNDLNLLQTVVAIVGILLALAAHIRVTGKLTESQLDSAVNILYPEFGVLYTEWRENKTNHAKEVIAQNKK